MSASSPAFADVSLHETRVENGISRMRALPALPVAAHGSVAFAPGSLHLMLMDPTKPLKAGDQVSIDFTLRDGRRIPGHFESRADRVALKQIAPKQIASINRPSRLCARHPAMRRPDRPVCRSTP